MAPGTIGPVYVELESLILILCVCIPGELAQRSVGEFLESHFNTDTVSNNRKSLHKVKYDGGEIKEERESGHL